MDDLFLLFLPGMPIIAIIALCIYLMIDYISACKKSKSIEVGCKYKYYVGDPFKQGYIVITVLDRWNDFVKIEAVHFDSDGNRNMPIIDSGTRIKLQQRLDKYNAKKI